MSADPSADTDTFKEVWTQDTHEMFYDRNLFSIRSRRRVLIRECR